jgi:hypothetical protein
MLLSIGNVDTAAVWCGGRVQISPSIADPDEDYYLLEVPTLDGILRLAVTPNNEYLVRSNRGVFSIMSKEEFEAMYLPIVGRVELPFHNHTRNGTA